MTLRHVEKVDPEGTLESPVIVAINPWSGEDQIMIRCTFLDKITGEYQKENGDFLLTRKQGINLPMNMTLNVAIALVAVWNEENKTSFAIVDMEVAEEVDFPNDEGPDEPWKE